MPAYADLPKALVEVGGEPLLGRTLRYLKAAGVSEITIVSGYRAEAITPYLGTGVDELFNPDFATSNNIYSLWLARELVREGCYIVNCDLFFEPRLATAMVSSSGTVVLCDGSHELDGEAMKVQVDQASGRVSRLQKSLDPAVSIGEYIGLTRVDPDAGPGLVKVLDTMVEAGETDLYYEMCWPNVWQPTLRSRLK